MGDRPAELDPRKAKGRELDNKKGTRITDTPREWNRAQAQEFIDKVKNTVGTFDGSYNQALKNMEIAGRGQTEYQKSNNPALNTGELPRPPAEQAPVELTEYQKQKSAKTTLPGMLAGFTRGVVPTSAAGAIGAVLGLATGVGPQAGAAIGVTGERVLKAGSDAAAQRVSDLRQMGPEQAEATGYTDAMNASTNIGMKSGPLGVGASLASGPIMALLNKIIAKNVKEDPKSWKDITSDAFTKMGVEVPDTEIENMFEMGGEEFSNALAIILSGGALQTGATGPLGQATKWSEAGKALAANPVRDLAGAARSVPGSYFGGEGAEKLGEVMGMGEEGQARMKTGGQVVGGILADAGPGFIDNAIDTRIKAGATPMSGVDAAFIKSGEKFGGGQPVTRSELARNQTVKNDTELARAYKREQRSKGSGQMLQQRAANNVELTNNIMEEAGVTLTPMKMPNDVSEPLMKDLIDTRWGELTEGVAYRDSVVDYLSSEGHIVETPKTKELLENLRAEIVTSNNKDLTPIQDKISNWEGMINNVELAKALDAKSSLGEAYKSDATSFLGAAKLNNRNMQSITNEIRDTLAKEIDDHIGNYTTPEDLKKWKDNNAKLSSMAGQFDNSALHRIIEEGVKNYDDIKWDLVQKQLMSMDPSDGRKVFAMLSPKGKVIAEAAFMGEVYKRSISGGKISPTLVAENMQYYDQQIRTVTGADLPVIAKDGTIKEIDLSLPQNKRYSELSEATEWLINSKYAEERTRGMPRIMEDRAHVDPGLGRVLPGAASATIGQISRVKTKPAGWIARQMESPRMRNLFARMSEAKPGSTGMDRLIKLADREARAIDDAQEVSK